MKFAIKKSAFACFLVLLVLPNVSAVGQDNQPNEKKPASDRFHPVKIPLQQLALGQVAEIDQLLGRLAQMNKQPAVAKARAAAFEKRAHLFMEAGKWEDAAADYEQAMELQPENTMHWMRRGILLALNAQRVDLVDHAGKMLKRFKGVQNNPYTAERTAKMFWLSSQPVEGRADAEKLADFAVARRNRVWGEYYPSTRAIGHYRYKEYDKALEMIDLSDQMNLQLKAQREDVVAINMVLKAMCHSRQGKSEEAAKLMKVATVTLENYYRQHKTPFDNDAWHNWVIVKLLHDEACGLIKKPLQP